MHYILLYVFLNSMENKCIIVSTLYVYNRNLELLPVNFLVTSIILRNFIIEINCHRPP